MRSANRTRYWSVGPHPDLARTGENIELVADGSAKPSNPLAADYVMTLSAFKKGFARQAPVGTGEVDGLLASVRQDGGDSAVYSANGQLVDRGRGQPGFMALFEGHSTLLRPGRGDISQDIDVQLGGINARDRSAAGLPYMHGLHAFKAAGDGGAAIYIDSRTDAARWDYGLQIRQGSHNQLVQRSSDAGLELFRHGSDAGSFLLVNTADGLRMSGSDSGSAAIISPDGNLVYDHHWVGFQARVASTIGAPASASATGSYSIIGNVCHVRVVASITGNGDARGAIVVSDLPAAVTASNGISIMAGRENARGGKMLQGVVSGNAIAIYNYDNSYPGSDGASLVLNGSYECAGKP